MRGESISGLLRIADGHKLTFLRRSRYSDNSSKGVVAIKKMPKSHKLEYQDLFLNKIKALITAKMCEVPRVIKYIEGAASTDDICLVLE